jgi:hypothetical protein
MIPKSGHRFLDESVLPQKGGAHVLTRSDWKRH